MPGSHYNIQYKHGPANLTGIKLKKLQKHYFAESLKALVITISYKIS